MLLSLIVLGLGVVSAAPFEERQLGGYYNYDTVNTIYLNTTPADSPDVVVFKMQSTTRDRVVAFHNGDRPYAQTMRRRQANRQIWDMDPYGPTSLRTYDDYDNVFCLDAGSYPAPGNLVHIWQCYPGLTQQTWVLEVTPFDEQNRRVGRIRLRDYDLCLDRNGANGQNSAVYPCSGSIEQTWATYRAEKWT